LLALLPLLIAASVVTFVLLWPRVRLGPGAPRLAAALVVTMLALAGLLYGLMIAAQSLSW
jgi:hypothetical protein